MRRVERIGHRLEDRFELTTGRVNLTGLQAVARAVLDSARRDRLLQVVV